MKPAEIIHVDTATVGCDGGGGALGHPLVYLSIGHSGGKCPRPGPGGFGPNGKSERDGDPDL